MDKPQKHINNIVNKLMCSVSIISRVRVFDGNKENVGLLDNDSVMVIIEGEWGLQRHSDKIILGQMTGPYIIFLLPELNYIDLEFTRDSRFSYLLCKRNDFYSFISASNLWEDLYFIMQYTASLLNIKLQVMLSCDLYSVIKYYLREIDNNPELRGQVNVCDYITRRSGFSKSGTMMVLSELKKGNYIIIERGRLKKIKSLPSGF
ncbi:helix-turn-helix domain-containing protein [Franconibacter pulveris]|uniref:helix-turn-helix domain-containing protein n=1 Tax=Franconibacter pulveris TaxID=435910 RepID=UPI0004970B08|nr:helix-turn-helix domain-containing protein [Franconibacter pulveris]